jgi:hypothetical protein
VKICSDQPKMMVWLVSITRERPFCSSSSLPSTPLVKTPIRVLITKTPPMVTRNMTMRKPQPTSPPIVPASRVRIIERQKASQKLMGSSPVGAIPVRVTTMAARLITISDKTPNQVIRATVPRENWLSSQY